MTNGLTTSNSTKHGLKFRSPRSGFTKSSQFCLSLFAESRNNAIFRTAMSKLLILPLFLVAILFSDCKTDPEKVKAVTKRNDLPLQTAHDIDVVYTDSAKIKIHLTAPQVDEFSGPNPYTVMSKGVRVEFYEDSGKVDSYLTSNYAIRREREQTMEAKYDVVVINTKGEKLNTEHLIWDGAKRRIYTEAAVKITTADQIIMGTGLESDEMFNNYEIKNITGTFMLKGDE